MTLRWPFQDTTFLDYVRGGLKLHFVVAIDFTTSNGMPNDPKSLHYLDRQRVENPYTMAIRSVGEIFQDYDYENRFLALGFGGQVNGRVSHCFPLNGNSRDPYCQGIEGVVDAYYDSLKHGNESLVSLLLNLLIVLSKIYYAQSLSPIPRATPL